MHPPFNEQHCVTCPIGYPHSALDSYEYESGALLECPVYSFGGKKDGEQKMENWAMESSSRKSDCVLLEGGSFYFLDRDNEVG